MGLRRMGLVVVMVAVVGTACSGGDDGGGDMAAEGVEPRHQIGAAQGATGEGASGDTSVVKSAFAAMDVPGRELSNAAQAVVDLATAADVGGFLVSSVVDLDQGRGRARVLVKVPAPKFEQVVRDLDTIGDVRRQELEGQDVAPQVLRARSRLQRATGRVADLIRRLDAADDEATQFQLRERLRQAREELRRARGDEDVVQADIALSSIDVALTASAPPAPPQKPVVERALATAKAITLGIVSATVLLAGVIVPICGALLVVYLVGRPILRRVRPRLQSWPG